MNSVRLRILLLGEFAEMAEFSELSLHEPLTAFTIYPQADTKMADEIDGSQYDVIAVTVASPIEDSLKVIKAVSSRLDTPIMGVLRVADESLEEEVYSAGCRHCFNVEPWSPRELALAVHETAIHDPMLCELLGVPFCEVNWEPNLFGDLLRGIAADAGDARQYFNGSVGERLATAMSASIVNPRYDLQ